MSDGLLWKRENWNWPARFCKEIEPLNAKSRSVRVYVCVRERKCESKAVRARERMSEWERESERAFRSNFQKSEKSLFKLDVSQQTTTIHDSTKKQKTKNFPQEDFSSKKDFFPFTSDRFTKLNYAVWNLNLILTDSKSTTSVTLLPSSPSLPRV